MSEEISEPVCTKCGEVLFGGYFTADGTMVNERGYPLVDCCDESKSFSNIDDGIWKGEEVTCEFCKHVHKPEEFFEELMYCDDCELVFDSNGPRDRYAVKEEI